MLGGSEHLGQSYQRCLENGCGVVVLLIIIIINLLLLLTLPYLSRNSWPHHCCVSDTVHCSQLLVESNPLFLSCWFF